MNQQKVKYYLDEKKNFVIENYNWANSFSNFFPGIGGKWGVPLWVYYVNRGQAISSLGIRDKDNAIMEFFSFNKACQMVSNQGFRTFLKINDTLYEPFKQSKDNDIYQKMTISAGELLLNEINNTLGIEVNVEYFPIVNSPVASLVRKVSIRNLRKESLKIELIDGLPLILSFGMNQHCIKFIARHIEAMKQVDIVDGTPFFRLKQLPVDTSEIQEIKGGNFYFSFLSNQSTVLKNNYVVDPETLFNISGSFDYPWLFESGNIKEILASKQMYENKTPCAFTLLPLDIPANEETAFYSIIGNASSKERLGNFKNYIISKGIIEEKREENRRVIEQIEHNMLTVSGDKNFDGYCGQTFLDNVMRGGLPVVFKSPESKSVFYLYSRKHGDVERDYNHFVLEQTYLSQGNSHYRDVNQNRRNDVWFNTDVDDSNIIMFFNLIQTDGCNPLVVNGLTYTAKDITAIKEWLGKIIKDQGLLIELLEMVKKPFTPGQFIMKFEEGIGGKSVSYDEIIAVLLSFCKQNDVGESSEGYWIDHWTYNLDLIDNFLMIYPEKLKEMLVDKHVYTFFDSPDIVVPRSRKYVMVNGKIRQYNAVERNKEKVVLLKSRNELPFRTRTLNGKGEIYTTNLLVKMLSLITNKISTIDPEGIGIEMESDKPGWNDPLNGLPGLIASSLCETLELKRCCSFLKDAISKIGLKDEMLVPVFEEMYMFIRELMKAIEKRLNSSGKDRTFMFWDESHNIKEDYREKTTFGISGKEEKMKISEVKDFLNKCLNLLDSVFTDIPQEKVFHESGICYTYFLNEVKQYNNIYTDESKKEMALNSAGLPLVAPVEFKQKPVSLFLEGPVHLIKVKKELADKIYRKVKESGIYDKKLKMYKTSEPITAESFEIGRARAYPPGWIENESVYLHMEYKYLLELLKTGLYTEYYEEIRNTMMPFLSPDTYGRSILESSSFVVSSSFPDSRLHGRGYQPRLTGATVELLNMWIIMVAGENPFFIDESKNLKLRIEPKLPDWLFTDKEQKCATYNSEGKEIEVIVPANCFAFKFLGKTDVILHNKKRKNTFGKDAAKIVSYTLKYIDGKICESKGDTIDTQFADDIRNGRVERIDAILS